MNKLISILASTVSAVSAMMTTSGTIKTSADADAFPAATEKTTYTIQDVRNLQGLLLSIHSLKPMIFRERLSFYLQHPAEAEWVTLQRSFAPVCPTVQSSMTASVSAQMFL